MTPLPTFEQWMRQNPAAREQGLMQIYLNRWVRFTRDNVDWIMPHQVYWVLVNKLSTNLADMSLHLYTPLFVIETRIPMWAANEPEAHLNEHYSKEVNYTVRAGKFANKNPLYVVRNKLMPMPVEDENWAAMLTLMSANEAAKEGV